MKSVFNDLPKELPSLEIELFFDLHIGSPKCKYQAIKDRIERVRNNDNVYAIIGGDLINNSTKASVGDVYSEPLSPMQQMEHATNLFRPIKDKILCITSGNHERRSYKSDGIDLLQFFSMELGLIDKYDYNACCCFLAFGSAINHSKKKTVRAGSKINYSIYITHGDGNGGRTVGGKANGLERRGQIIDADIIVTGHTHQAMTFRETSYRTINQTHTVVEHEQVFVNASATLGYEGYAELYGLKPSSIVSPRIILRGDCKNIAVTL